MVQLEQHPTVKQLRDREAAAAPGPLASPAVGPRVLDHAWLKKLSLEAGADDVGFVEIATATGLCDITHIFAPQRSASNKPEGNRTAPSHGVAQGGMKWTFV